MERDPEAIIQDADIEQAELEAAGNRYARLSKRSRAAALAGDLATAARLCPHGWGYPLHSIAATREGDPNAGEAGSRCRDCGSRLAGDVFDRPARVIAPCEWRNPNWS